MNRRKMIVFIEQNFLENWKGNPNIRCYEFFIFEEDEHQLQKTVMM